MRRWSFAKGHGTENDFVLLQDRESMLHVGAAEVRFICDRHAGIGADGLLRAVRARHIPEWDGDPDLWFMDYRNADGSVAEMCGNGIRVFARHLLDEGLATGPVVQIATRAGLKEATALPDTRIRVAMGPAKMGDDEVKVTTADGRRFAAVAVNVGNPHAVSFADDIAGLPLQVAPTWTPEQAFPRGVNLEFVREVGPRHIEMRVYERGVGETRSCGTGTVAAAAAARKHLGDAGDGGDAVSYRVDVPGGSVTVELAADQTYLTGPAVIVANGHLSLPEEF
ncbi:MAG: Diaminopimelate epimerase [uncultured Propionibacteriaceae bacterium]|uniref:Diaminopimelate epimerase n=1 Tax=uncultured Propionibacteriaceae bacterium TaxID=257457 RepID=A0A6J4NE20_9ACTN|nr:MAG: Diaminopimelate epimerase [uncultured Propionibacteriaceae bacterium]